MEKLCDLHTHTVFSDGTLTPEELVALAVQAGLSAIALTDHNTVKGLPRFLAAGQGSGVETVPGIEFTTEFEDDELHILGLYVPEAAYGDITEKMDDLLARKQLQNRKLVEALAEEGIQVDFDALRAASQTGNINRAHIATAMVEKGYVATRQEAFQTWLSPKRGLYVPPKRLDALETVGYIRSLGAVPVLAHPFLSFRDEGQLEKFLSLAKPLGLRGMEVVYSENDEATTQSSRALTEKFGLLPSGGSDFHGANKPYISLGTGKGNLRIPLDFLENLKNG